MLIIVYALDQSVYLFETSSLLVFVTFKTKKNMLKKVLTVTTAMAMFFAANSQDSTKGTTTYTTSVDAYYRYDFSGKSNNITSFTNSINSMELGMASFRIDHSIGKVAATADFGFGRRAAEFSYNDVSNPALSLAAVKQAYVSYQATSKVKFTVGKWATHVGWELLDAYNNRNYSMSYGFSEGPFFHTGAKADFTLGAKSGLMLGVANPTDFSTTTSGNKMIIGQFFTGTKNDKVKAYLNFQGGADSAGNKVTQEDLVLNFVLSSKWGFNFDGTIQSIKPKVGDSHSWSSFAGYLTYDPTSKIGWTLREELFSDKNYLKVAGAESIMATTLSADIHLSNLTIIPELRLDNAKHEIFSDKDGKGVKSATSFILAATYKF